MGSWVINGCNGDFVSTSDISELCATKCEEAKAEDQRCCEVKCIFLDHSLLTDGKINKTALATLFGQVGDPKIIENIAECEALGKCSRHFDKTNLDNRSEIFFFSCEKKKFVRGSKM